MRAIASIFVLLVFMIGTASAAEYTADLTAKRIQQSDGNNSWVTSTKSLNLGETWAFGDINIKYNTIESTNDRIWFSVTGSGIRDNTPLLTEGASVCLRGTCSENMTIVSSDAVQLTLTDIRPTSTWSGTNTSGDNPIYAYVYADKELPITKDQIRTYDAKQYNQQSGWTTDSAPKEVYIYFQRRESIPASITVTTEPATIASPKDEWISDKVKYIVTQNGKYTFKVKYDKMNYWGAKTETTDTYTVTIQGLAGAGASTQSAKCKPCIVYLPDTLTLEITPKPTFQSTSGVTIAEKGDNKYEFSFVSPSAYTVKYTTSNGDDYLEFSARAQPSIQETVQETLKANQAQNNRQDGSEDTWWSWWYLPIGLVLVGIIGWKLSGRRKGFDIRKDRLMPKS